ncbi:hypothetical protein HWV62_35462 [Athelia sp. TMB]|nr:hypothetical protein HWV62_4387 [Athelia sp. TMB]KAF7981026.1 hypothetical protein HWV62_35462 [Athelia sp. TMB]
MASSGTLGALFPSLDVYKTKTKLQYSIILLSSITMYSNNQYMQHFSPVFRVPNELLENIFNTYVTMLSAPDQVEARRYIVAYTQVCRFFRDVAHASPRLWRFIDLNRPRVTQVFLQRSRSAVPLTLLAFSDRKLPQIEWMNKSPNFGERVSQVDVELASVDLRRLLDALGPTLPQLYRLRIVNRKPLLTSPGYSMATHTNLPSLRHLVLHAVKLPWQNLTDLIFLHLADLEEQLAPSLNEIYALLSNNRRLEHFQLSFVHSTGWGSALPPIELAELKLIHLVLPPDLVPVILRLMSFPLSTHLRVGAFSSADGFLSIFPKTNGALYSHLAVTEGSTLSILLRTIRLHRSASPPFSDGTANPGPVVTLIMPYPAPAYASILQDAPKLFDLFWLSTLELDVVWAVDEDSLAYHLYALLTATPNLTTLRVSQHGGDCLSRVLGKPGSDRLPTDVLCPRLTRLSFGAPDQMWWDFPQRWINPLVACLQERAFCTGAPLKTIEFLGQGRIERSSAAVLEPYVGEILRSVTWSRR